MTRWSARNLLCQRGTVTCWNIYCILPIPASSHCDHQHHHNNNNHHHQNIHHRLCADRHPVARLLEVFCIEPCNLTVTHSRTFRCNAATAQNRLHACAHDFVKFLFVCCIFYFFFWLVVVAVEKLLYARGRPRCTDLCTHSPILFLSLSFSLPYSHTLTNTNTLRRGLPDLMSLTVCCSTLHVEWGWAKAGEISIITNRLWLGARWPVGNSVSSWAPWREVEPSLRLCSPTDKHIVKHRHASRSPSNFSKRPEILMRTLLVDWLLEDLTSIIEPQRSFRYSRTGILFIYLFFLRQLTSHLLISPLFHSLFYVTWFIPTAFAFRPLSTLSTGWDCWSK